MPITIKIEGMAELIASMQNLPNVVKQSLDDELLKTAENIVDDAKKLAPVDLGNLYQHIRVTRDLPLEKWVSSEAEYSAYVEFGTGTHVTIWPGFKDLAGYAMQFFVNGRGHMRAHPFFFPSYQVHTVGLLDRLKKIIEEDAKEESKK